MRDDSQWSSAGEALEPGLEPLVRWRAAPVADRRGIEALNGKDSHHNTMVKLSDNGDQRPHPALHGQNEDPYADELAQRSAEFARHAAFDSGSLDPSRGPDRAGFDAPTPPQGVPEVPSTAGPVDQTIFSPWAPQLFTALDQPDNRPDARPAPVVPMPPQSPPPVSFRQLVEPDVPSAVPPAAVPPSAAPARLHNGAGTPVSAPPGLRPILPPELTSHAPEHHVTAVDPPLAAAAQAATMSPVPANGSALSHADAVARFAEPVIHAMKPTVVAGPSAPTPAATLLNQHPVTQHPGVAALGPPPVAVPPVAHPDGIAAGAVTPLVEGSSPAGASTAAAAPKEPSEPEAVTHRQQPPGPVNMQASMNEPRPAAVPGPAEPTLHAEQAGPPTYVAHPDGSEPANSQQHTVPSSMEDPRMRQAPVERSMSLGARFGMAFADELLPGQPYNSGPPDQDGPVRSGAAAEQPAGDRSTAGRGATDPEDLPQRVPSAPDVPPTVHPIGEDPTLAGMPQLSRIASHLKRDDVPAERPDGFDVEAVLHAVRGVAGVRAASLRKTPNGAHHLRLDLAEGADPSVISRMVARMLQDQMGLDASPALPGDAPTPAPANRVPEQAPEPSSPGPATLPAPRSGAGAAPPPSLSPYGPDQLDPPVREPRRRHPVSVPRRAPGELRGLDRIANLRAGINHESEQPAAMSPPPLPTDRDQGPRPIIDHVQTSTFGLDATVEVRLTAGDRQTSGVASGPAVDAYVLRLCAAATAAAIDDLLREGTTTGEAGRCFVEQATIVPMGTCEVAVVVVLLVCGGWVEQLAGSALVSGDPRRAVVRATLGAVNRRLAALLP